MERYEFKRGSCYLIAFADMLALRLVVLYLAVLRKFASGLIKFCAEWYVESNFYIGNIRGCWPYFKLNELRDAEVSIHLLQAASK